MKILVSTFLSLLVIGCNQTGSKKTQKSFLSPVTIDKIAKNLLNDTLINALSIGIYYKEDTLTRHYGELDKLENNIPSNETIYEIASVTKTFVGVLIAQAEMEGKLSLEDDIRKYLVAKYENLEYNGNPIRIRHLLTHTSELPKFLPESINELFNEVNDDLPFRIAEVENNYSKSKFLEDLKKVIIDSIPGTRFSYSNADTELAAFILEKVYDKPFDSILEEKICSPFMMPNTKINLSESQKIRLANGYCKNGIKAPHMSTKLWGASGAGKSTIPDLINYMKFQLDESNEVIHKTHQTLYNNEIIYGDPNNELGYFWILNKDEDFGKSISHHGGAFGTQNWLILYPKENFGITIISNQGDWQTAGKLLNVVNNILVEIKKSA